MEVGRELDRLRGHGRGWTLTAIALGWVFVLGGRFLLPSVLPQVKETFAVGDLGVGVAVTVIWATYAVMQTPAGLLIDSVGERRLLAGSLLLTGGSVLVVGLAPAFLAFLVGCGVFGLATGLYGPARGTALSRTFPDTDGTAIGATLAAGSVGSAVLPFLAGALVGRVGWRLIVAGLLPPLVVVALLAWRAVPDHEPRGADRGANEADREQSDADHESSDTDGVPSDADHQSNNTDNVPSDADHQSSDTDRVPADRLAREVWAAVQIRGVAVAGGAVALMLFAFQGVSAFYVTYLVSVKSFGQTTAAAMFALVFVGGAIAQLVGGRAADRVGDRPVLVATAAAGVPLLAAVPYADGLLPVAGLSLLIGSRLAIAPVSNAYVIAVLPEAVTGTAWGVFRTGFFLLGAGGSTVVGALADRGLFDESFFLLAGVTGVAAVLYALLPPRESATE